MRVINRQPDNVAAIEKQLFTVFSGYVHQQHKNNEILTHEFERASWMGFFLQTDCSVIKLHLASVSISLRDRFFWWFFGRHLYCRFDSLSPLNLIIAQHGKNMNNVHRNSNLAYVVLELE